MNAMEKYFKLILVILCLLIERTIAEEKYIYTDIVTIKWGSKAGEIGEGFDRLLSLPYIIKANANNKKIYLYDNINTKIESFDYNGNHLHSFPTDIEFANTMFFDNKNNVILIKSDVVGPRIDMRKYNSDGGIMNKFELTPEKLNIVEFGYFFIVDQTKLIFPNLNNNRKFWELNIETGGITHDVEPKCITYKDGIQNIFRKKEELIDKKNDKYEYNIEVKDKNGKILNKIPIDVTLGGYSLSCVDKNNFIYLVHESSETQVDPDSYEIIGNEVQLTIAKYNEKGELILKQKLMEDYDAKGLENKRHSFVDIDVYGNIFQILGRKDGVHILRWEQKTVSP